MNEIISYTFKETPVRTTVRDGNPWFVASDVAKALEYRGAFNAARILDDDEKGTQIVSTPSGDQEMTVINESGLYHLVIVSRKPEAKKFRKWVTSEVLPSIRKTGGYNATPALDAKAIGGIVKKCAAKAVKDELAECRAAPFKVATAYEKDAFEDNIKRLVKETLIDFFAPEDNAPHPSGMAFGNWAVSAVHAIGAMRSEYEALKKKKEAPDVESIRRRAYVTGLAEGVLGTSPNVENMRKIAAKATPA